ncbi:MAG: TRAP transporter substrate-binding protein, partial [Ferrovibrio sp.]
MKTRNVAHALLGLALAAGMAGAASAKEFRSSDVHPMDYPTVTAVMEMGKLINERTKGKHSVKVFGQSA